MVCCDHIDGSVQQTLQKGFPILGRAQGGIHFKPSVLLQAGIVKQYIVGRCFAGYLHTLGFGLSYTTFTYEILSGATCEGKICFEVQVTNTGNRPGKEVVQVYAAAPAGSLSKAKHVLVAYSKTDLLAPGESQTLTLTVRDEDFASFDDSGSGLFPYHHHFRET